MIKQQEIADELEKMVDKNGLRSVVDALALMCSAKSDHIREAWQDEGLADQWDIFAGALVNLEFIIREAKI